MFFLKKKKIEILAPTTGTLIKIEEVKDPAFSSKMLGDGFGIIPDKSIKKDTLIVPISGTLTTVMDTGHAYGIIEKITKIETLIHIGIDTVELKGSGFEIMVKKDQVLEKEQPLVTVSFTTLKTAKKDSTISIVFNNDQLESLNYKINILKFGKVQKGEIIAELIKK